MNARKTVRWQKKSDNYEVNRKISMGDFDCGVKRELGGTVRGSTQTTNDTEEWK